MKKLFFILIVLLTIQFGHAQVGINTTTPDALLQIKSSNQATPANNDGILIPKIDAFPVTNPTAAQNSMMVYLNVDLPGKPKGFYYWDSATINWKPISSSNWTLTGANLANNNTGNVGVGTGAAIPSSLLTVKKDGIGFTQEDVTGVSKIGFFTVASDAWIQTHSNSDLKFATNNGATQMTLQKGTGNLGINTVSPTEKLEVAGKTKTSDLQVTTGAGAGKVLTSDAVGNATWQNLAAGTGWLTLGNAGTNAATNFIGTTDDVDLVFKRFNSRAGFLSVYNTALGAFSLNPTSVGLNNVAIGSFSLNLNTNGVWNTAIGRSALIKNTDGNNNTSLGAVSSVENETGNRNVAIGASSLSFNKAGSNATAVGTKAMYNANNTLIAFDNKNVAVGYESLRGSPTPANNTGNDNTAIGYQTLLNNSEGRENVAVGTNALQDNEIAIQNTAVGVNALKSSIGGGDDSGSFNVAVGYNALTKNEYGTFNTAVGSYSLENNVTGAANVALGNYALNNTTAHNNIAIGTSSMQYNNAGSRGIGIGTSALANFGNTTTPFTNQNIAIGFEAIKGSVIFANNTGNSNTVVGYQSLFSNSTGSDNTAIGYQTLLNNSTGSNNVAVGKLSLRANTIGTRNVAIGTGALESPQQFNDNTAIGYNAIASSQGNKNTAVGSYALRGSYSNLTEHGNSAIGYYALNQCYGTMTTAIGFETLKYSSAEGNTAVGAKALSGVTFGTTGTGLVAVGYKSMMANTNGSFDTAIGNESMFSNTSGVNNTALGFQSLYQNILGSNNIAIGFQAGFSETGSNKLYIENSNSSTPLIYGEFDNNLLRFHGNLEIDNLASANNKMQVVNKNNFVHGIGNQIFGNGGDDFIISSKEGATETAGIYGDGNAVTIWSAGDANQGQNAALVYFLDEDNFDASNTNPYDASTVIPFAVGLKSYITPVGAYFQVSDKNKKENIQKIENATDKINQISGYTYQFKLAPNEIEKGDKPIKSSGVLAQEVEKILPEAVQKNANGDYFVDYAAITPLLIEAIKDQNAKIKELETANTEILKRLEKLENK